MLGVRVRGQGLERPLDDCRQMLWGWVNVRRDIGHPRRHGHVPARMGHRAPHQGARCGRRIEIGTRSTRLMEAAADCARNATGALRGARCGVRRG